MACSGCGASSNGRTWDFGSQSIGPIPIAPVSSRSLMAAISGSQPEDARSSRVGSMTQWQRGLLRLIRNQEAGDGTKVQILPVSYGWVA